MRNESVNLSKNEMIMVMHDQEQEIENLKAKVAELQAQLNDYDIKCEEAGTLADAAAQINDLFASAQATADAYIESVKRQAEKSDAAMADVEQRANEIIQEAEGIAQSRLRAADEEIEKKWTVIESRMLNLYESHKGLRELMESGIFQSQSK